MPWTPTLTELQDLLAGLYDNDADRRRVAAEAGLPVDRTELLAGSVNAWHRILKAAQDHDRLAALIAIARNEYKLNERTVAMLDRIAVQLAVEEAPNDPMLPQIAKSEVQPRPGIRIEPESKKPGQSIELVPPNLLRITDPIHLDLVRVPAGEFLMGTRSSDIERLLGLYGGKREEYEWETEQFQLALPEFYIAKTMVTVEQFEAFVKDTGYQTTAEEQDGGCVRTDGHWECVRDASWREPRGPGSDTGNKLRHPVTQVSFYDGQAFCDWLKGPSNPDVQSFLDAKGWDLRMPTEAEWERAARGPQGRVFPWGDEAPDGHRCNFGMRLKDTTPVDAYPNGQSKDGVFDMAGNVWEWTMTRWNSTKDEPPYPYPYHPDQNREDPNQEGPRVMRGGSFHDKPWEIRCAFRHKHDMDWSIDCGSFRVCVVKR